jgi:thiol-disulfide isomerase/thioredoxin
MQSNTIPTGEFIAPEFSLPGTDGKIYTMSDFYDRSTLVVAFMSNHCPYALAAWPLLITLAKFYELKGVQIIAINPNDEKDTPEDSFEMMKEKVKEWGVTFPYLRDGYQEIAHAYKAVCTPDIYVFDQQRKLYYHGRINDRWQDQEKVTREDLKLALDHLLAGDPAPTEQIPSMGCSIKWIKS